MDLEQHSVIKIPQMPKPMQQDVTMAMTYALSVVKDAKGPDRSAWADYDNDGDMALENILTPRVGAPAKATSISRLDWRYPQRSERACSRSDRTSSRGCSVVAEMSLSIQRALRVTVAER